MEYASLGGAVTIIMALVSVCKATGLKSKYAGIVSVFFGIVAGLGMMVQSGSTNYINAIVGGLIMGLTASGTYSGGKALITK